VYPVSRSLFRALESCRDEARAAHQDAEAACIKLIAELPISLARSIGNRSATSIYTELFQFGWHTGNVDGVL
jgi:hypothetical protein